jgi:hypothetical protein
MLDTMNLGTLFAALYVSHQLADHWAQTQCQANGKGGRGWAARIACAKHVATHITLSVACLTALLAVDVHITPWRMAAGLAVIAVTHYWADRREPLRKLATMLGKAGFHALGAPRKGHDDNPTLGTGAYALDQSFHFFWLFIAALIMA